MKKALMIAEKPSLAMSIANLLSNGKCSTRKGANHVCSVHEWNGTFKKSSVHFKMTSVCGHVMSMDFIGKFNNWNKVDPAELFHCTTEKKEANPKLQIPKLLYQEAKGCDYLILWLDCDKEGENICFEVIDCVAGAMNSTRETSIYRARFSAITETEVKAAMDHLVPPNENEARSVDARQELDLRIGCAFTRYQTKYFQGKYGNLDSSLISFGPCQTPTLGFCVDRHDQILTFKPEPYWVLQVSVEVSEGKELILSWERGRCFDKEVAHMFLNLIKDPKTATVISISKKEQRKPRPLALNTVELMKCCSSGLGMGPHQAMQIAEKLYIQGYISYPRTETTHYPASFDLKGALHQQKNNPEWGSEVSDLLSKGINSPRKGVDVGDHPPITPTKAANPGDLDSDSWKIYEFITRSFIGSLSYDCKYLNTTILLTVGDEKFNFVGKTLIEPGYTSVMSWQAFKGNETVPELTKGTQLKITEKKLLDKQTSPPDYLTESELITLMERHGIGTDASIPVHINNICQRNYVQVTGGRRLIPTTLGIVLVHGYQKIDHDLVLPTMRSAVENQLNLIAQGKADFNAVLSHTLEIFKLKFHFFVSHIEGMDQLFEVSFSPLSESGKVMSRCGKCHRYMRYVQTKPSRLHCTHCGETYSLPQNGIKLYKEQKCPLDDFELLYWSGGTKGKSYPFCPYCYNNPPFREMKKNSGCNECSHPTCPHSFNSNGVASCPECESGILVLDPFSCPKWKLSCNKCDILFHVFNDASKVTVLEDKCDQCNCQQVSVEYKSEKSRLPDGETEASGCIFCLPHLQCLIEKHHAINKILSRGNNRIGTTRGRGRGSTRGRGRGKAKRSRPKDKMAMLDVYFV